MEHEFCHLELQTNDLDGAKSFYSELFDWKVEGHEMPYGEYAMINPGKGPMGGMMKNPEEGLPPLWYVYICVEDVTAHIEKAEKLGAKCVMGKTPVEGMGFFAFLLDPQGAPFAIWESVKK